MQEVERMLRTMWTLHWENVLCGIAEGAKGSPCLSVCNNAATTMNNDPPVTLVRQIVQNIILVLSQCIAY